MQNKFLYIKERCKECGGLGYKWSDKRAYRGEEESDPIQCDCLKKIAIYSSLDAANVPREYFDLTLEDFRPENPEIAELKNKIKKTNESIDSFFNKGKSLFFYGPNGSGKTMLAVEILKAASRKKYSIYYDFYPIVFESFNRKGYKSDDVKNKYDEIFSNVDFLVLDEMGKEFDTPNAERSASARLLEIHILKKRGNKPVIFISNFADAQKEVVSIYGNHVNSMLKMNCKFVQVKQTDYRGKIDA